MTLRSLIHLDRLSREQSFRKSPGMLHIATVELFQFLLGLFQKMIHFLSMIKMGLVGETIHMYTFPKRIRLAVNNLFISKNETKILKLLLLNLGT